MRHRMPTRPDSGMWWWDIIRRSTRMSALSSIAYPSHGTSSSTFVRGGVPPAPFCSPTLASIIAAREPDSSRKELYFVLIPDSGGRHDFSKTLAEHEAKARKYGWK